MNYRIGPLIHNNIAWFAGLLLKTRDRQGNSANSGSAGAVDNGLDRGHGKVAGCP